MDGLGCVSELLLSVSGDQPCRTGAVHPLGKTEFGVNRLSEFVTECELTGNVWTFTAFEMCLRGLTRAQSKVLISAVDVTPSQNIVGDFANHT